MRLTQPPVRWVRGLPWGTAAGTWRWPLTHTKRWGYRKKTFVPLSPFCASMRVYRVKFIFYLRLPSSIYFNVYFFILCYVVLIVEMIIFPSDFILSKIGYSFCHYGSIEKQAELWRHNKQNFKCYYVKLRNNKIVTYMLMNNRRYGNCSCI
jgi:hypothetical protein